MDPLLLIQLIIGLGSIMFVVLIFLSGLKRAKKETLKCPYCGETFNVEYFPENGGKTYVLSSLKDYEEHFKKKHPSKMTPDIWMVSLKNL